MCTPAAPQGEKKPHEENPRVTLPVAVSRGACWSIWCGVCCNFWASLAVCSSERSRIRSRCAYSIPDGQALWRASAWELYQVRPIGPTSVRCVAAAKGLLHPPLQAVWVGTGWTAPKAGSACGRGRVRACVRACVRVREAAGPSWAVRRSLWR